MKKFALALALVATPALAATEAVMHRDPGCGCCEKWAAQVRKAFGRSVKVIDDANRPALQRQDIAFGSPWLRWLQAGAGPAAARSAAG